MAAFYSEEIIKEVIESNDIVDIIGDDMTLKKTGNSFKGKCPFHNEKTASFTVSREKQLYHCFGCGAGGNVITYVMEMEKLSFVDALKVLAERANIVLPENSDEKVDRKNHEKKQRLYELHREVGNYYFKCLKDHREGLLYLENRGISLQTIKTFGLGYSKDSWDDLVSFLTHRGYKKEEMLESGLVMVSDKQRYYDRFRNRLMFPILNPRNQIIGFGGRKFSDEDNGPKYLNSPETPIFSKSYELFNLNRSKNFLEDGKIIIVEGYMDVISLYEKGLKNTVAALGTAFTPFHGKALERYVNEVIIGFDGDNPGLSATEKAVNVLKNSHLNVKILKLPPNEDPDSFIRKVGLTGFNNAVDQAMTCVEYRIELLKRTHNLDQTDGRLSFGNKAIQVLKELDSTIEIDYYSKVIGKLTGINPTIIGREVLRLKNNIHSENTGIQVSDLKKTSMINIPKAYDKAQKIGIRYCLKNPRAANKIPLEYMTKDFYLEILSKIMKEYEKSHEFDPKHLIGSFEEPEEVRELAALTMDEDEVSFEDFNDALEIMERFYREHQIEELSLQIKNEMAKGNEKEVAGLTNKLIGIKKKMKENRR